MLSRFRNHYRAVDSYPGSFGNAEPTGLAVNKGNIEPIDDGPSTFTMDVGLKSFTEKQHLALPLIEAFLARAITSWFHEISLIRT